MHAPASSDLDARGLTVAIVTSRYHRAITEALRIGAAGTFAAAGGMPGDLVELEAPGAFELPVLCRGLAARPDVDGVVALGCVIRGETAHDQYIAQAVATGLTTVALETGKPVAFGVLTCQTLHQARARAGGDKGNKGAEAMAAVVEAIRRLRTIGEPATAGEPRR